MTATHSVIETWQNIETGETFTEVWPCCDADEAKKLLSFIQPGAESFSILDGKRVKGRVLSVEVGVIQ